MKMSETCFACANRMRVRVCNKIPLQQWLDLKTWPKKKARWNFVAYARSSGAGPKTGAGAPSKCIKSPQTFSLYVSASHELGRVRGCVCAKVLAYFMKLGKAFNNTGTPTDRGKLITRIYLALKPNVSFASAGWFGAHIRAFPEFGCHLMAATASCVPSKDQLLGFLRIPRGEQKAGHSGAVRMVSLILFSSLLFRVLKGNWEQGCPFSWT